MGGAGKVGGNTQELKKKKNRGVHELAPASELAAGTEKKGKRL